MKTPKQKALHAIKEGGKKYKFIERPYVRPSMGIEAGFTIEECEDGDYQVFNWKGAKHHIRMTADLVEKNIETLKEF